MKDNERSTILGREASVISCKSCESGNHRGFSGEVAIRFPEVKGLNKLIVWVSRASVLLGLWFHEIRNLRYRVTTVTGKRARLRVKASDGCD
jgi:hypothetical protein